MDCCPQNAATYCCSEIDKLIHFNATSNIDDYSKLWSSIPIKLTDQQGLDKTDSRGVAFNPDLSVSDLKDCIKLVDLTNTTTTTQYERDCLTSPENCDYGISFSMWVNFTTEELSQTPQYFFASGNSIRQGFFFYYELGSLKVKVIGARTTWFAQRSFSKRPRNWLGPLSWRLIGFTWARNGIIRISVELDVQTFLQTDSVSQFAEPGTSLYLGCTIDHTGVKQGMQRMVVVHPALWIWPIQSIEFFTGGLGKTNYILRMSH